MRLGLDSLHWPLTRAAYALDDARHAAVRRAAWAELVGLKREGLVEAIGVSNFSPRHVEALLDLETPAVLQVEMHLLLQRPELRAFCEAHEILLQAYGHHRPEVRQHPPLRHVAQGLVLDSRPLPIGLLSMRWALQSGVALIPRSRQLQYVDENLRVFDFSLPPEALKVLAQVDANASLYGLHEAFVRDWIA
jgi:diketogulonate reductase-like aldo/keto reductase